MYVEEIINGFIADGVVKRLLQRYHCPSDMILDLEQDLYLDWLNRPDGILKASDGGYLIQYVTNAVRNQVLASKKDSSRFTRYEIEERKAEGINIY